MNMLHIKVFRSILAEIEGKQAYALYSIYCTYYMFRHNDSFRLICLFFMFSINKVETKG